MKWEGNRESDNVEDRRGDGGGGGSLCLRGHRRARCQDDWRADTLDDDSARHIVTPGLMMNLPCETTRLGAPEGVICRS